jgi:translation initiation factor 3 subunit A
VVQEEEEARRQEEYQRQQIIAEQKRLNQEREERERKRQENELQQIKDRHLKEKMQQISQTTHGQRILKKLEEDVNMKFVCMDSVYFILFSLGHQKNGC